MAKVRSVDSDFEVPGFWLSAPCGNLASGGMDGCGTDGGWGV